MSKKQTRKQKEMKGRPNGKSKYAMKVERRKRLARSLGMSDVPFPVLLSREFDFVPEDSLDAPCAGTA